LDDILDDFEEKKGIAEEKKKEVPPSQQRA
jgi:hypothetical protein